MGVKEAHLQYMNVCGWNVSDEESQGILLCIEFRKISNTVVYGKDIKIYV